MTVLKAIGATVLVAVIGVIVLGYFTPSKAQAPEQPIEFSHRIHAGENQISCQYCHSAAARSTQAGVPSVATCYECHRLMKAAGGEIDKVMRHWQERQPIRWRRIHSLPDHVYFSHKRHVLAEVSCETCHGDLRTADRVSQFAPLTMGWCVNCHQSRGAVLECSTCHR